MENIEVRRKQHRGRREIEYNRHEIVGIILIPALAEER
jgi:hypothetical protein